MIRRYLTRRVATYLTILLPGLVGPATLAQPATPALTDADKREIKFQAKKRIEKDLADLYNTLTFEDLGEADRNTLIQNSFLPNPLQLFDSDGVIVEDDVDPAFTSAERTADMPVEKYLRNLDLFYEKTLSPTITVTNAVPSSVLGDPAAPYVKVFFTLIFKGKHGPKKSGYQPNQRVAELKAVRNGKKWLVYISRLAFVRPGEGLTQLAVTKPAAVTVAAPPPPPPVNIREPTAVFRQHDYEFNVTIKYNKKALEVLSADMPRLPLGQYRREGEAYLLDGNSIVFEGKNKFTFTNRDRSMLGFFRLEPPKPDPIATAPAPASAVINTPGYLPPDDSQKMRRERKPAEPAPVAVKEPAPVVAAAPKKPVDIPKKPTDVPAPVDAPASVTPKTASAPSPVKPAEKPAVAKPTDVPALTKQADVPKAAPPQVKPESVVVKKPESKTVSAELKKSLTTEQQRMVKQMKLRGWVQVVGGLAALGGSYVAYSTIKKDYNAYTTRVEAVNSQYAIYRELAPQPQGASLEMQSMGQYASPVTYGIYGGGAVGIGLTVNGIRTLFKAGRLSKKK